MGTVKIFSPGLISQWVKALLCAAQRPQLNYGKKKKQRSFSMLRKKCIAVNHL
jgi:hypothetical protein